VGIASKSKRTTGQTSRATYCEAGRRKVTNVRRTSTRQATPPCRGASKEIARAVALAVARALFSTQPRCPPARLGDMLLDHHRLTVYRTALSLLAVIDEIAEQLPPGRAHLKDRLDRAATSVVLNIAEGAGEFSPRDKARFYRMARRSATESSAILDILQQRQNAPEDKVERAREFLVEVVSMLVRMIAMRAGARAGARARAG
jgi:four helix bundle protein